MVTTTTNYALQKATVGGDVNLWGGYTNNTIDAIDALLGGDDPIDGIDIDSGSIDGTVIGGSVAAAGSFTTLASSGLATLDSLTVTTEATITNSVSPPFTVTGTTPELDPADGNLQRWTLTGNSTPTEAISAGEFIILLIDGGTSNEITWPTIVWLNNGGVKPAFENADFTCVTLLKFDTTLYGVVNADGS